MDDDSEDFVNELLEIAMNSDVTLELIDDTSNDDEEYDRIIKYYNITI
jgi:hypothetical protein